MRARRARWLAARLLHTTLLPVSSRNDLSDRIARGLRRHDRRQVPLRRPTRRHHARAASAELRVERSCMLDLPRRQRRLPARLPAEWIATPERRMEARRARRLTRDACCSSPKRVSLDAPPPPALGVPNQSVCRAVHERASRKVFRPIGSPFFEGSSVRPPTDRAVDLPDPRKPRSAFAKSTESARAKCP